MEFYQLCLIGPWRNYPSVEPLINYVTFITEKIFSFKPKFDDHFFVDLCVLNKLWTWNCSASSAYQNMNNFMFPTCKSTKNWSPKVGYGSVSYSFSCNMAEEGVKKSGKLMTSFMFWYAELAEQFHIHNL